MSIRLVFPRRFLQALWPLPVGLLAGYLWPKHWPYTPIVVGGFMAIMVGLVVRMLMLVTKMRVITLELHNLVADAVLAWVPEAKKIDLRMSDHTAQELIETIAMNVRAAGMRTTKLP